MRLPVDISILTLLTLNLLYLLVSTTLQVREKKASQGKTVRVDRIELRFLLDDWTSAERDNTVLRSAPGRVREELRVLAQEVEARARYLGIYEEWRERSLPIAFPEALRRCLWCQGPMEPKAPDQSPPFCTELCREEAVTAGQKDSPERPGYGRTIRMNLEGMTNAQLITQRRLSQGADTDGGRAEVRAIDLEIAERASRGIGPVEPPADS